MPFENILQHKIKEAEKKYNSLTIRTIQTIVTIRTIKIIITINHFRCLSFKIISIS